MATIAVGDIHGNREALEDLLELLGPELRPKDTLVFLGDYIDRGPDSRNCLDRIVRLGREVSCSVVGLRGNHEDWMLRTRQDHTRHSWILGMEALETITSYSPQAAKALRRGIENAGVRLFTDQVRLPYELFFDAMPQSHLSFLENLEWFWEDSEVICVHAGLDPRIVSVTDQRREALLWGMESFPEEYSRRKPIVYGHADNAVIDAAGLPKPFVHNRTFGIDTVSRGVLTAIRFPDLRVFQSRRFP